MNKRHSRSERAGQSRMEQADQSMSGAIKFEHIKYGARISDQTELMGMIRLEKSIVKAGREKTRVNRSRARTSRQERRAVPKEKRKT